MYFWKCWRDSALYFIIFLGATIVVVSLMGSGASAEARPLPLIVLGVAALGLGAAIANEEFANRTLHFLLTKPRSRAYFVWMGWATGLVQLTVLSAIALAILGVHFLRNGAAWSISLEFLFSPKQLDFAGTFVYCLALYCLTYALTVLLRNGFEGVGIAVLLTMANPALVFWVRTRWQIRLPMPGDPIGPLSAGVSDVMWTGLALALVASAERVVERFEPK